MALPPDWAEGLELVDHHCHSVVTGELDAAGFESLVTEGDPPPPGLSGFDSLLGLSVRRWCAPVLDLPPHADADAYLARRAELGAAEVTRRLMRAADVAALLVDTGFRPDELLGLDALAQAAGAPVAEVVRLESVAERAAAGSQAAGFGAAVTAAVHAVVGSGSGAGRQAGDPAVPTGPATGPVGLKSVAAYRTGLDLPGRPPDAGAVARAAEGWLRAGSGRLDDATLVAHAVWAGVETGLPIQFHTGFGDADERLPGANPVLLQAFARGSAARLVLLHCWPYHREAAWLAHVLPGVHLDIGLAVPYTGARASALLAETLELAPFGKLLYSSDAFGLAELHLLGALRFRRAVGEVLGGWVEAGEASGADARRIAGMLGAGNARRLYRLPDPSGGA